METTNPDKNNEEVKEEKPKRKYSRGRKTKEILEESPDALIAIANNDHMAILPSFVEIGRYQKDISDLSHKLNAIKNRCKASHHKRYYLSGRNCRKH